MPIVRIARAYRHAFSGIPRTVWVLAFANFVNRAGGMVLPFLTLYLTTQLGFTPLEAGRTLSLYGLGSVAGAFLGGWLSDRVSSLWVQRGSLLGTGVGFLVLSQLRGRWTIGAAVFVVSLVTDAFRPSLMTSVRRSSPPAVLPRALTLHRLSANLGFAFGPAIGGFLAAAHYGLLFVCDALTCWAAAALLFALRPEVPGASPAAARDEEGNSPWRDGVFLAFLSLTTLLAIVFFQILVTFPVYLREAGGHSERTIGTLLGLNGLAIALFEIVLVGALERLDRLRVASVGVALVCLGLGLLSLGASVPAAAAALAVFTAGEMIAMPMINAAAAERGPASRSGSYLGAYTVAFSVGWVVAPSAGMGIYAAGGGRLLWAVVAAMAVPLGLGYLGLARWFRNGR
jgi:predicted MFS family arabinose efflux permease